MGNKKKWLIGGIAAGVVIIAALAVTVPFLIRYDETMLRIDVYYYNPAANQLESERRVLSVGDSQALAQSAFALLCEAPRSGVLQKTVPEALALVKSEISEDALLTATFSGAYNDMSPLDEAIFRASFVWTMTELPMVQQVKVLVEDEPIYNARGNTIDAESRASVRLNPNITPERTSTKLLRLYFPNEQTDGLIMDERTVSVDPDSLEKNIIQQLILGTSIAGGVSPIPTETKILEIKTVDGICHVNLSNDFISKFNGSPALARLTLYAIVNTLIDNSGNVKKVQFLIGSEMVEQFHGVPEFDKRFEWDDTLIIPKEQTEEA